MALNVDRVGLTVGPETFSYDADDVILYALGVGAEEDGLDYVYEKNLQVLPGFATVAGKAGRKLGINKHMNISYEKLLHGENRIEVYRPLPANLTFAATNSVVAIYDKGKGAVVVTEMEALDESGERVFKNISHAFVRGEGGFGGERGPSGPKNEPPKGAPDHVVELKTGEHQAALYRLNGDKNLLHIDPDFAKKAGFDKPILHGLCTYGIVCRAIVKECCGGDPTKLNVYDARFAGVVFPGDTLRTEIWNAGVGEAVFQTKVADRLVLSQGKAEFE